MNDLKPASKKISIKKLFQWCGRAPAENADYEHASTTDSGNEVTICAIPSTHRVVSVELLQRLTNHQPSCFCNGHNTCQMCLDFKEVETLINKET